MSNPVRTNINSRKVNRIIVISFVFLGLTSLLCANGLHEWKEANDLISLSLPGTDQIGHISPDVKIMKFLLEFAKNIITLNF